MNRYKQLEHAALDAHRLSWTWNRFWQMHGEQARQAEPYDRGRYRKLVAKLLHLVASGDPSGMEPVGEPWLDDDQQEVVSPDDTTTAIRIDWTAAGIAQEAAP